MIERLSIATPAKRSVLRCAGEREQAGCGAQRVARRSRNGDAAVGGAGRAVVGIGGAVEVTVAGGSGCDVEGIRGRPAGVLYSMRLFLQGTFTPKQSPMLGAPTEARARCSHTNERCLLLAPPRQCPASPQRLHATRRPTTIASALHAVAFRDERCPQRRTHVAWPSP